jgi:hypothetical protein
MRVFRTIFFLGAIAILMPSPPEDARRSSLVSSQSDFSAPEMINAASRTVSDMGDFCFRQPMVCATAGFIATKLEAKAKYSAKLIYEWANEASRPPGAREERLTTANLPRLASNSEEPPQSTLKVEDLIPDWRNPLAARKG